MATEPITVLVDTREQKPWQFTPGLFQAERATLQTGDYSVKGIESRMRLERKSIGDLVGTVISDWIRFRKELYRLAFFDVAAIVVEGTPKDIWDHRYESDAKPESVMGRVNGIYLDHGVPVLWWGERSNCVRMVENFFRLAIKKLRVSDEPEDH